MPCQTTMECSSSNERELTEKIFACVSLFINFNYVGRVVGDTVDCIFDFFCRSRVAVRACMPVSDLSRLSSLVCRSTVFGHWSFCGLTPTGPISRLSSCVKTAVCARSGTLLWECLLLPATGIKERETRQEEGRRTGRHTHVCVYGRLI